MTVEFNGDLRDEATAPAGTNYTKSSGNSSASGGAITRRTDNPRFPGKGYFRITLDAKPGASNHRNEMHVNSSETFAAIGVDKDERRFYAMSIRFPAGWSATTNFGVCFQVKNIICNGGAKPGGGNYPSGRSPSIALDHKGGTGMRIAIRGGDYRSPSSISPAIIPDSEVPQGGLTWMDFIVEVLTSGTAGQVRVYYKEGQEASFAKIYENLNCKTQYIDTDYTGQQGAPPNFERIGLYRGPQTNAVVVDITGHIRTTTLQEAVDFFGESFVPDPGGEPDPDPTPIPTAPLNTARPETTHVFGATTTGDTWGDLSGDYFRGTLWTCTETGTLERIRAYVDGKGSGASGVLDQDLRATVHSAAGAFIGESSEGTIVTNDNETWKSFACSGIDVVEGQTYLLGLRSGATSKVGRYAFTANVAGALSFGADTYADGIGAAPGGLDNKRMAIYAVVTPNPTAPPPASGPGSRVPGGRVAGGRVAGTRVPNSGGGGM